MNKTVVSELHQLLVHIIPTGIQLDQLEFNWLSDFVEIKSVLRAVFIQSSFRAVLEEFSYKTQE